jgi:hypothetical protein
VAFLLDRRSSAPDTQADLKAKRTPARPNRLLEQTGRAFRLKSGEVADARPVAQLRVRWSAQGVTGMLNFLKSLFGVGADAALDHDLVARIFDNLKREPSDQLRTMLDPSSADKWSPEALHAARLLLDQRVKKLAAEPVYRTVPRTAHEQAARGGRSGRPAFRPTAARAGRGQSRFLPLARPARNNNSLARRQRRVLHPL